MQRVTRWLAICILFAASGCGDSADNADTDITRWLEAAARVNETPALIACTETAMRAELSEAEIREWLSHDPARITVEEIQALPQATVIADQCRHLMPSGAP
jgi:hypothetical protein